MVNAEWYERSGMLFADPESASVLRFRSPPKMKYNRVDERSITEVLNSDEDITEMFKGRHVPMRCPSRYQRYIRKSSLKSI